VRVHVIDVARVDPRVIERDRRGAGGLAPVSPRLDHVVGIGRGPVAEKLGIRRHPASLGRFRLLEHEQRRAFAHDEPVALGIERASSMPGVVVVTGRQCPDDVKRPECQRRQRDLAATGDRSVDPPLAQVAECLPERHATRRARVRGRQDRPADIERDAEVRRRSTAEDRQRERRGDMADAHLHVPLVLFLRERDAAQRRAEVDADPVRIRRPRLARPQPGVVEREPTRHHPELAEPIELAGGLRRHPGQRIEVVDLGGHLAAERRGVEPVDAFDRRLGTPKAGAERVDAGADRRDEPDPRDPDPAATAHVVDFVAGDGSDPCASATASASALNVASVRPAIGRVKKRSTKRAKPGNPGEKSCEIVTRQVVPSAAGSIRQTTSIPRVAPPMCSKCKRSDSGSFQVRDHHMTGNPSPSTGTSGRRATNSMIGRPQPSVSSNRDRT
jgi:hypothetical protein